MSENKGPFGKGLEDLVDLQRTLKAIQDEMSEYFRRALGREEFKLEESKPPNVLDSEIVLDDILDAEIIG